MFFSLLPSLVNQNQPLWFWFGEFFPKVASSCGRSLTSWCELCFVDDWSSLWPEASQGSLSHGHCLWLNTSHRPTPKGSAPSGRGAPTFFSANKEVPPRASVQFSCSVMSDSLWSHGLQHARPPCPSPAPGVYSNSCPLSRWCHATTSSSVVPFSSRLQSFPASGSFPVSQFFTSGGQSIGVSVSASFLPMNIQDWFPLGWTGWTQSFGSWNLAPCPLSSEWTGSGAACEIQGHVQLSGSTWVRGYVQTRW